MFAFLSRQRDLPTCLLLFRIFSCSLLERCKKHSALKDLRNSAIVLNLNRFRGPRTDGWVHSQIRHSIVQSPVFSLSLSLIVPSLFLIAVFCLPLYHCCFAALHTLHMQTHLGMNTLLYSFSFSCCLSHLQPAPPLFSPCNIRLSPPSLFFPGSEDWDKSCFIRLAQLHKPANQQTGVSLCLSNMHPLFCRLFLFPSFQTWETR